MITVSKEDYLKSILEAESEGEAVISARLADLLKVSPPAVTMALRRLKKDGLVSVETSGEVRLTAAGRKIARKLTLRHHLIERMLSELFGMEWWKVHDEAERLEHAVSPDFEAKLLAKLGSGGACPHGNLSELEGPASRRRRGLVLLADAELDNTYTVSGIYERDRRTPGIPRAPRCSPRSQVTSAGAELRSDSHALHSRRNRLAGPRSVRTSLALSSRPPQALSAVVLLPQCPLWLICRPRHRPGKN